VNSVFALQKIDPTEVEEDEKYEWTIENVDEDEEEEEGWEYYYEDEEYEYDYDEAYDDEDEWTPEQLREMDALYDRYLQEVAAKFGANWEEQFDLVVSKEEVYEEYLNFEEQKKIDAEEQRRLIEVTHMALLVHDEALRIEEENSYNDSLNRTQEHDSVRASLGKSLSADPPPRTHMVVLGTGDSYNKSVNNKEIGKRSNWQACPAKTTIVTTQGGNSHTVIGSI